MKSRHLSQPKRRAEFIEPMECAPVNKLLDGSTSRGLCLITSKMKTKLHGLRSRCNEVCAAERGQKIVHGGFIGQVDDGEPKAPLVAVTVEEIIVPYTRIEQVARSDTRRIVVWVVRAGGGETQKL